MNLIVLISSDNAISLLLKALFLLDSKYQDGYRLTFLSIIALSILVIGAVSGFSWLVWKDMKSKKIKTGIDNLIGKEAEVTEVSSSGTKGWVMYEGENWKFSSADSVQVGDIVSILYCKRMVLKVKKTKESNPV